jgi:hypothetical protein
MESLLEAVVDQRSELGRDGIPLLERGFDRLHSMLTRVASRRAIGLPERLIAEFDARARGTALSDTDRSGPTPPVPAPRVEHKPADLKPLSAPISDMPLHDDDDIGVRAPQEQVRIRADLLDRLVNYAGEVAIYRARLEQQLGAFRGAMVEMEQTNLRLRDQLRRLDSETEAQIIARYQRENETSDQTFDPLELDRFSTLATALARPRRVRGRPDVAAGVDGRPHAPVRNAAAAAVPREFGIAGRPHAHAHGAVRCAGPAPAPRAATGGQRHRQAGPAQARRCAGRTRSATSSNA